MKIELRPAECHVTTPLGQPVYLLVWVDAFGDWRVEERVDRNRYLALSINDKKTLTLGPSQ